MLFLVKDFENVWFLIGAVYSWVGLSRCCYVLTIPCFVIGVSWCINGSSLADQRTCFDSLSLEIVIITIITVVIIVIIVIMEIITMVFLFVNAKIMNHWQMFV
jgi:hypothetical protein